MTCVITIAAIKHEAETYHRQGLHREALAVYDRFLVNNKEIHPVVRTSIEASMRRIKSAIWHLDRDENMRMSNAQITLVKKGWSDHATMDERLTSARALAELGHYKEALQEYGQLLVKRRLTAAAVSGMAQCLVHLIRPERFAMAVDLFAAKIFAHARNRRAFKLLITRQIDPGQYPQHLSALKQHLSRELVSDKVRFQIRALGRSTGQE